MLLEQKNVLDVLKEKMTNVISLFEASRKENAMLKRENAGLISNKEDLEKKFDSLKKQYESLKLAKTVSVTNDDTEQTKNRINNIVREIDKCIALLNR